MSKTALARAQKDMFQVGSQPKEQEEDRRDGKTIDGDHKLVSQEQDLGVSVLNNLHAFL
jgi:hypothetical protein